MAEISSQIIAKWVAEGANDQWVRLDELCASVMQENTNGLSDEYITETVARELEHVTDILKEDVADAAARGEAVLIEIDDETPPYLRAKDKECAFLLKRLRKVHPNEFEKICFEILKKFGAEGGVSGGPFDGGVDFQASQLVVTGKDYPVTKNARVVIVGQAKRYAGNNIISESELRKFIGGATRRVHELRKKGDIGALTPVVYAFWTSSDFDRNASKFAHDVGIWTMNGVTMSIYVAKLGLVDFLDTAELVAK